MNICIVPHFTKWFQIICGFGVSVSLSTKELYNSILYWYIWESLRVTWLCTNWQALKPTSVHPISFITVWCVVWVHVKKNLLTFLNFCWKLKPLKSDCFICIKFVLIIRVLCKSFYEVYKLYGITFFFQVKAHIRCILLNFMLPTKLS